MGYYAMHVILLKQCRKGYAVDGGEVKGIARIETSHNTELEFSAINLCELKSGIYRLLVYSGTTLSVFHLNKVNMKLTADLSGDDGEYALLLVAEGEELLPVMYGRTEKSIMTAKEMTILYESKKTYAENKNDGTPQNASEFEKDEASDYSDEAIVSENYYQNDDVDEKTFMLKETKNGEGTSERIENADIFKSDKTETEQDNGSVGAFENAPCDGESAGVEEYSAPLGYYNRIRGELERIFNEYEREEKLDRIVPESRWAKIPYDNDKYYAVGLISRSGVPQYVCYGVPGFYAKKPEEIKEYCSFIPTSVFDLKSDGYWVMYQDADTGECIKEKG